MFRPLDELINERPVFLPTGVLAVDTITGGGIPAGHITDIVGEKGLGKTTLALHTAGKHLAAGHPVYYVDSEFSFHAPYAATFLPPNHEHFYVFQHSIAEEVYSALEQAATTPNALLILDSINALLPSTAVTASERGIYDTSIGHMARITTVFLKRILPLLHQHRSTLLVINQYRANITTGLLRGPDKKPAGFHYYHHCIYTRLELAKGDEVKNVGRTVIVKTTKNKAVGSHQTSTYVIKYHGGIDVLQDHVDFALRAGILTRAGSSWYQYVDPTTGELRKVQGIQRVPSLVSLDTIYHTVLATTSTE